jgi:hypothetical protein
MPSSFVRKERSWLPPTTSSSASSHRMNSVASPQRSRATLRVVAKSTKGASWTSPGTPSIARRTRSRVSSVEPVSSTTQRSMKGFTEARVFSIVSASSLTIMQRVRTGRFWAGGPDTGSLQNVALPCGSGEA